MREVTGYVANRQVQVRLPVAYRAHGTCRVHCLQSVQNGHHAKHNPPRDQRLQAYAQIAMPSSHLQSNPKRYKYTPLVSKSKTYTRHVERLEQFPQLMRVAAFLLEHRFEHASDTLSRYVLNDLIVPRSGTRAKADLGVCGSPRRQRAHPQHGFDLKVTRASCGEALGLQHKHTRLTHTTLVRLRNLRMDDGSHKSLTAGTHTHTR